MTLYIYHKKLNENFCCTYFVLPNLRTLNLTCVTKCQKKITQKNKKQKDNKKSTVQTKFKLNCLNVACAFIVYMAYAQCVSLSSMCVRVCDCVSLRSGSFLIAKILVVLAPHATRVFDANIFPLPPTKDYNYGRKDCVVAVHLHCGLAANISVITGKADHTATPLKEQHE